MKKFDNLLNEDARKRVYEFLNRPGWSCNWKSNVKSDVHTFMHKHFAGHAKIKDPAYDCADELRKNTPLIADMWAFLASRLLQGHTLVRCYANAHAYGMDGTIHYDANKPGNFTAVYYPHETWSPNWGGETVFFNKEETDLIWSVYPRPNRLVIFPGVIPHAARGVSRTCPVLRMTLMFKTECSPVTKTS